MRRKRATYSTSSVCRSWKSLLPPPHCPVCRLLLDFFVLRRLCFVRRRPVCRTGGFCCSDCSIEGGGGGLLLLLLLLAVKFAASFLLPSYCGALVLSAGAKSAGQAASVAVIVALKEEEEKDVSSSSSSSFSSFKHLECSCASQCLHGLIVVLPHPYPGSRHQFWIVPGGAVSVLCEGRGEEV